MDIPGLSIAMSADRVSTQWGLAMMAEAIDMAEVTSDSLAKLMESSVTPNLGQNIDIRL